MADQNYEIATKIGWTSDDAKLKDVVTQLEKLNATTAKHVEQQKQAKAASDQHGEALGGLARKAAGLVAQFVGVAAAVRFAWSAFKEGVEADKLMVGLAANARMLGNATDKQVDSLKDWVFWLERASGIDKQQLVPAVTMLMGATNDLASAQLLAEIAAGAAARQIGTFENNVAVLTRTLETGMVRGISPLANEMRKVLKGGEDITKMLPELVKKFGDGGEAVNTVAMQLARQKIQWHDSKEEMGRAMEGISTAGVPILKGLAYALGLVGAGVLKVIGFFASLPAAMKGHFVEAYAIQKEWSEKATKLLENIGDAWAKPAEAAKRSGKEEADAMAAALAAFKKALDEKNKAQAKANKDARDEEKLQALPKARAITDVDATNPLTGMPFKVEEKMVKEALARQVEEWRKNAEKVDKIHKELASKYKNWTMAELQAKIDELREIEATEMMSAQTQEQIEADLVNAKAKLDQASMLDATKFALSQFGNVKGVAIAQALINTYEGATKALSAYPPPFSFIAAAAVIAAGLMQVKQITSAEPGIAGGASAGAASATMPPMVYTGAPATTAPTSTTSVQSTVNQPTSVTINTLTGDGAVQTAREFQRILRPGSRSYDRGLPSRKPISVGTVRR